VNYYFKEELTLNEYESLFIMLREPRQNVLRMFPVSRDEVQCVALSVQN